LGEKKIDDNSRCGVVSLVRFILIFQLVVALATFFASGALFSIYKPGRGSCLRFFQLHLTLYRLALVRLGSAMLMVSVSNALVSIHGIDAFLPLRPYCAFFLTFAVDWGSE